MSLNWNLAKIAKKDDVCYFTATKNDPMRGIKKGERYIKPTTEAMIWYTMSVGIPRITEDNWKEFYARVRFIAELHGPMVTDAKGKNLITWEIVRAHIGLATNASKMSRNQFTKLKADGYMNERLWSLDQYLLETM